MTTRISATAILLVAALGSSSALGHARFTLNGAFQSRTGNSGLKTAPCGTADAVRGQNPTILKAGQQVTVEFLETINHQGSFDINFSADGVTFDVPLISVEDTTNDVNDLPHKYEVTITIPNTPCETCVLQMIQNMVNGNVSTPYYSCADIVIKAADDATVVVPPAPAGLSLTPKQP